MGVKHSLKKYAPELLSKGAGDVYDAVNTTYKTFNKIQGIIKLNDASEEKKMDKALSVYNSLLTEHYSDKTISDKMIDSLYNTLSNKFETFVSHLNSYASNTEIEKNKKDGWWTSIKCPTNVYVYDKQGNLVGYIEGDYIEYNDEIVLEKLGDVKRVYLPDINDYEIKVVATDNGVLNYSVEQYVDNAPIGRINYYDIELYEGKEILSSNEASTIEDYENLQLKSDNTSIVGEYISSADNASINIWGMCEGNGNIIGLGSYVKGDGVVLSAVPDEGYVFDGWYIDGELMSTNINYSFCATSELTATAKFSIEEIISTMNFDESNDTIIITSQEAFDDVELIVAIYLDGRLLKVKSTSVDIAVGENIFDSSITDYTDGDVLKVMVWESASSLKPLFDACVVELK